MLIVALAYSPRRAAVICQWSWRIAIIATLALYAAISRAAPDHGADRIAFQNAAELVESPGKQPADRQLHPDLSETGGGRQSR